MCKKSFSLLVLLMFIFSYSQSNTIKDIDGNVYSTVKIGNQVWIKENYKVTRYRDGTPIMLIEDSKKWSRAKIPAYCWYANDIKNKDRYGALYNWYAVNNGQLAPPGWHLPDESDWDTLVNYLISSGYNYDSSTKNKVGKALAAESEWFKSSNTGAVGNKLKKNNTTGFSALPAGFRALFGRFDYKGNVGSCWWTDTRYNDSIMHSCALYFDRSYFDRARRKKHIESMSFGFSVRIVKKYEGIR